VVEEGQYVVDICGCDRLDGDVNDGIEALGGAGQAVESIDVVVQVDIRQVKRKIGELCPKLGLLGRAATLTKARIQVLWCIHRLVSFGAARLQQAPGYASKISRGP